MISPPHASDEVRPSPKCSSFWFYFLTNIGCELSETALRGWGYFPRTSLKTTIGLERKGGKRGCIFCHFWFSFSSAIRCTYEPCSRESDNMSLYFLGCSMDSLPFCFFSLKKNYQFLCLWVFNDFSTKSKQNTEPYWKYVQYPHGSQSWHNTLVTHLFTPDLTVYTLTHLTHPYV